MEEIFEVRQSEHLGRYLIAKKDFPKGMLICREDPIIVYPYTTRSMDTEEYFCFSCYCTVKRSEGILCEKCHWPACSIECAQSGDHSNLECSVLAHHDIFPSRLAAKYLCIIKSLTLKNEDIPKWNSIMNLSSDPNYCREDWRIDLDNDIDEAHDFLNNHCGLQIDLSVIQKLISIFTINSFSFVAKPGIISGHPGLNLSKGCSAIYATSCLMAHSCCPNLEIVEWNVPKSTKTRKGKWSINLFTVRDIKEGERVAIAYMDDYLNEGNHMRRCLTLEAQRFLCQCERCTDPTEMGLYYSAVQCNSCKKGWMVPKMAADYKDWVKSKTLWKCEGCSHILPLEVIQLMETCFTKKVTTVWKRSRENPILCAQKLNEFIETATRNYSLHPNNYLVIKTIRWWLTVEDMDILLESSPASKKAYEKYMTRCSRCLRIYQKIGSLSEIVEMHALLSMVTARYRFKSTDYLNIKVISCSLAKKIEYIKQIVNHMKMAVQMGERKTMNGETMKIVELMKTRLPIWNSRLTKYYLQNK